MPDYVSDPILRVDVSRGAPDFEAVTIGDRSWLLDRQGEGTFRILRRWFGDLVAQPRWQSGDVPAPEEAGTPTEPDGDAHNVVEFYVAGDDGARLLGVKCFPLTNRELKGSAKEEYEAFCRRVSEVRPETPVEQNVLRCVQELSERIVDDTSQRKYSRDNYFFTYRDANGKRRVVWCWGFVRKHDSPGYPTICPNCRSCVGGYSADG
jgi:hypothetical protein